MNPRSSPQMLFAPGSTSHAVSAPSYVPAPRQPAIDDNVLAENCGYEIVEGQVYKLSPAQEDHGTEHFLLPAVLGAFLAPAYKGTVDMLTRPSTGTNFAPDVSILPRARDPETQGRQIEDLIFEVIDTESLAHVTEKTRTLIARGVRRAFVIDVNARSAREWSRDADDWARLADDAVIVDRCFAVPVPVSALVDEVLNENVVAEALVARSNPVITRVERTAEARGREDGARASLLRVLARRGLALSEAQREQVQACGDVEALHAWLDRAVDAANADAVFAN